MSEWLNAPYNAYVRYTHQLNPKALSLISKYGWFFDDKFFYWQPPKNKNIIKKAPVWMAPQKRIPTEKFKKYHAKQRRLDE